MQLCLPHPTVGTPANNLMSTYTAALSGSTLSPARRVWMACSELPVPCNRLPPVAWFLCNARLDLLVAIVLLRWRGSALKRGSPISSLYFPIWLLNCAKNEQKVW